MKRPILLLFPVIAFLACRYEPLVPPSAADEDVIAMVTSCVERDPDDYLSMYVLARVAEQHGNTREVVHWLSRLEATSFDRVLDDGDFPKSSSDPRYQAIRDRLGARARVVRSAEPAFSVGAADLLPEGMAYDPTTDRFLISSGRKRKVLSVGREGGARDLVTPMQDGLYGTLGMKVDDGRRELWVASVAAPDMIEAREEDAGRSALFAFDADSGRTMGIWDAPWTPAMLNDVAVAPNGSVFATDTISGAILRHVRGADDLDTFVPRNTFFEPNGIAISEDGATLWVAHYHGISRVDVRTRSVTPLVVDDPAVHIGGIDGLYVYDGRLVGIQNLVGKGRIWSLSLHGDHITSAEILESGNPEFRVPTTGVVVDGAFFFMSNPNNQRWDGEKVTPPHDGEPLNVMWIPLAAGPSGAR